VPRGRPLKLVLQRERADEALKCRDARLIVCQHSRGTRVADGPSMKVPTLLRQLLGCRFGKSQNWMRY
jgi:hypothetical protein